MKSLGITLVIALSLTGLPELVEASGRRGGDGGRGFRGGGLHHHHHHHRGFAHRQFFPVFVAPSAVVSTFVAPPVVYAPPPVYAAPPVYSAPPFYAPPPAYAAPPPSPPPPIPRVVEHPGGRYELRGDGMTSPYVWVWIPNPPAAPPPAPAPPAEAPEPSLSPRAPAPRATTYRWTDNDGVTTWTDSLEKVPTRFRAQAAQISRYAIAFRLGLVSGRVPGASRRTSAQPIPRRSSSMAYARRSAWRRSVPLPSEGWRRRSPRRRSRTTSISLPSPSNSLHAYV